MPRSISSAHRASLEASHGEDHPLVFIKFSHASLSADILVVNDLGTENGEPVQWQYGGVNYIAYPFDIRILTDNEDAPRAVLEIANVDQSIGEAVKGLSVPVAMEIAVIPQSEFDTSVNPRTPLSSPDAVPIYTALGLKLRDVRVDAMQVRGVIGSLDDTLEPWPGVRATKALFPGLYL